MTIHVDDIVKTSSGAVGVVRRLPCINGAQFIVIQLFVRMHFGVVLTRHTRLIALSEVVAVRQSNSLQGEKRAA